MLRSHLCIKVVNALSGSKPLLQPIAGEPYPGSPDKTPRHIELLCNAFSLDAGATDMWGVTRRECVTLQAEGNEPEMLERIYTAHEAFQRQKGLVLVEGTHKGKSVPDLYYLLRLIELT